MSDSFEAAPDANAPRLPFPTVVVRSAEFAHDIDYSKLAVGLSALGVTPQTVSRTAVFFQAEALSTTESEYMDVAGLYAHTASGGHDIWLNTHRINDKGEMVPLTSDELNGYLWHEAAHLLRAQNGVANWEGWLGVTSRIRVGRFLGRISALPIVTFAFLGAFIGKRSDVMTGPLIDLITPDHSAISKISVAALTYAFTFAGAVSGSIVGALNWSNLCEFVPNAMHKRHPEEKFAYARQAEYAERYKVVTACDPTD